MGGDTWEGSVTFHSCLPLLCRVQQWCDLLRACPLLAVKLQFQWRNRHLFMLSQDRKTALTAALPVFHALCTPSPLSYAQQIHLPKSHPSFPLMWLFSCHGACCKCPWLFLTWCLTSSLSYTCFNLIFCFICRSCLLSWKERMSSLPSKLWKKMWC